MDPSIEIYKAIAEHAAESIFVVDKEGRINYANPAAEKIFGYTAREFSGEILHDLVCHHRRDGSIFPRSECSFFRACRTGETIDERQADFIRKDGSFVSMSCSGFPVSIDGRHIGAVILARDVAQPIKAEQALAESERRFRLITDSMPQLVWTIGPNRSINFANARFRQYTGSEPNAEGQADYARYVHPDDLAWTQSVRSEALRGGGDVYRMEHRLRAADGSYRWFLTHVVPVPDAADGAITWYGSSTDIDDIRRTTDALRKSQETLRLAAEATGLGLWDYYPQTGELVWSETKRRLTGVPLHEAVTYDTFLGVVHPDDRDRIHAVVQKVMMHGSDGRLDAEFRINRQDDGEERWLRTYGKALWDSAGQSSRFIGTTLDITETKLAEKRIREASQHDALTGLPNRASLFEYCEHMLAMAKRTRNSIALLFIDLDRFKPINDTHGHDIGDQVLKQVAKRLTGCIRQEDIVGRLGGDEFVIAVRDPDDVHSPVTVAQHIIAKVSEPYHVGSLQLHLSPSIGISLFPQHGISIDDLVKYADTAMYAAKKAGRKRYKFYTPALEGGAEDHQLWIEMHLKFALENEELALHYQPVLDMESGHVVGAEALLRLPIPDGAPLVPIQFLHIAEAAGLIHRLGEWVAREACRQHQRWRIAGLPDITIAINVAAQQFRQRSFMEHLAGNLNDADMTPASLQIELKESTVIENGIETRAALEGFRSLGVRIALDNFGVGHASVGLLSNLPLDLLKIDQSLVGRIVQDAKTQTVTDTIIALGKCLKLKVVGEGIESEATFDYLRSHGCDQAQGYYFSKPLSADEFERWYKTSFLQKHFAH